MCYLSKDGILKSKYRGALLYYFVDTNSSSDFHFNCFIFNSNDSLDNNIVVIIIIHNNNVRLFLPEEFPKNYVDNSQSSIQYFYIPFITYITGLYCNKTAKCKIL